MDNFYQNFETPSGITFSAQNTVFIDVENSCAAGLLLDRSTSMEGMEPVLNEIVMKVLSDLKSGPVSNKVMLRTVSYGSDLKEMHKLTLVDDLNAGDVERITKCNGYTELNGAIVDMCDVLKTYGSDELATKKFINVNGILIIVGDGMHTGNVEFKAAQKAINAIQNASKFESFLKILIGVKSTDPHWKTQSKNSESQLRMYASELAFDEFIWADELEAGAIAKIVGFISSMVTSQTQSSGTGAPSQIVKF